MQDPEDPLDIYVNERYYVTRPRRIAARIKQRLEAEGLLVTMEPSKRETDNA